MSALEKPENLDDAENLIKSLVDAIKSRLKHDEARDKYEGYDWGYAAHNLIDEMDKDAENFARDLNAYIDKRVVEKMRFVKG